MGEASAEDAPAEFDIDRPWQLNRQVAIRPESFGALLYDFGTRRLSFLKTERLVEVVQSLGEHETARSACAAAGVGEAELPSYERALAALAAAGTITATEPA
jgi:putative mycofactocin binding protein MftB